MDPSRCWTGNPVDDASLDRAVNEGRLTDTDADALRELRDLLRTDNQAEQARR